MPRGAPPALTAVALCAALLASCGGDEERDPPSEPPAELLATAAANPPASGEAAINLGAALEGTSVLAGNTTAEASGPFALDESGGLPSFDLSADAEVAGFGVDVDLVSTGDDAFVVFFGENYRVGPELTAQVEDSLAAGAAQAGGLGIDVAEWVDDPAYVGNEDIGGAETVQIDGTLDAEAAGEDLAALGRALGATGLIESIAAGAEPGPVSAWVAYDDQTFRRLALEIPFTVPPRLAEQAAGITGGVVGLELEVTDVGAEVTIEPPEGGGFQPIDQLISRIIDLASLAGL